MTFSQQIEAVVFSLTLCVALEMYGRRSYYGTEGYKDTVEKVVRLQKRVRNEPLINEEGKKGFLSKIVTDYRWGVLC